MLKQIQNKYNCYFTYLTNKYWSNTSILVPKNRPIIDENYKTLNQIFKDNECLFTEIYWQEIGVIGEIKLPGEFNYGYINDKAYHLVKTKSDGEYLFHEGENETYKEFFYYQLIYDDGTNEFLNNSIMVNGSIIKTGDEEKIKNNIHRVAPITQNVNYIDEFDCGKTEIANNWNFLLPRDKFFHDNSYYGLNPRTQILIYNFINSGYERNFDGKEDNLKFPFLAQETQIGNGKTAVISSLIDYLNRGLAIFDLNKQNFDYSSFLGKYRPRTGDNRQDDQVYVLTHASGIKNAASTYVRGTGIKEIDLTGLIDVVEFKPNLQAIGEDVNRTGGNFLSQFWNKVAPGESLDSLDEVKKMRLLDLFYTAVNKTVIDIGGRLLTNVPQDGLTYSGSHIPPEKYQDYGFYRDVAVTVKNNNGDDWTYINRKFNHNYFGGFDFGKPGDYMTENKYQKNHILFRNTSSYAGGIFLGCNAKKGNDYLKKIRGATYKNGKDSINKNYNEITDKQHIETIEEKDDHGELYTHIYKGEENFNFSNIETNHKLRGLLHLDRYELKDRSGKIIKPHKGILLMPDYENGAYVFGEYETSELTEGVQKKNGLNKVFAFSEILDHTAPVKQFDFSNPREEILTGKDWEKVNHSIRLGTVIKRLLIVDEDEKKQVKIRFKRWWPTQGDKYYTAEQNEYKIAFYIPNIPRGSWEVTFPVTADIDIMELLNKYGDVPNDNFAGINGSSGESKGIEKNKINDYYVSVFKVDESDFNTKMKYSEIPEKTRNNCIFVFIDTHPKEGASEGQKARLKELIDKLHTAYFRSPGNNSIVYQSSNVPGNLKRQLYKKDATNEESGVYYGSMTNFRPYSGIGYPSRIIVRPKFEADRVEVDNGYEQRAKKYMFSFYGTSRHQDGMILVPFESTLKYENIENVNYHGEGGLNNIYLMGMADKIDNRTQKGIFTDEGITFQEEKGYMWDGENSSRAFNNRLNRQNDLAQDAIFMQKLKDKSVSYVDKNLENPKEFHPTNYYINDSNKLKEFYERQNQLIPEYVGKYITPDTPISPLHHIKPWDKQTEIADYGKNEIVPKIEKAFNDVHTHLISNPVLFDLVGTNFLALASYDNGKKWSFELIIKDNGKTLIKEGRQTCKFPNFKTEEDPIPKAINSVTELNIYGHKIPLKERFALTGSPIEVNCQIEKVNDRHQGPADWYHIEIQTKVDKIRMDIEVIKDKTISANISLHDKQRLFNEYLYNNADRYWETQKYNLDKEQFFRNIDRERRFQGMDAVGDLFGTFNNVLALKGAAMGGVLGGIGGGLNVMGGIFNSVLGHIKRGEERTDRLEIGIKNFRIQGDIMAQKHKSAEEANLLTLQNLANNNRYPEFNNGLIFEEVNKMIGRSNIYLTRYSPCGELLEELKDHYDEYGYEVFLSKQTCTGIDSIKKHIKFLTITQNIHPNETIRAMIEQRLLTGVKVVG